MYLMLFPAIVFALKYWTVFASDLAIPFMSIFVFVLCQPLLALAGNQNFEVFLSGLSYLTSIISALGIYLLMKDLPRHRLQRMYFVTWAIFIVLAILESYGLRPVFDAVRADLYADSNRGVYLSTARDISIYGRVRPTVLASEPSFLAMTLATLSFLALAFRPKPRSKNAILKYLVMIAVSYVTVNSLSLVFHLTASLLWLSWPNRAVRTTTIAAILLSMATLLFWGSSGGADNLPFIHTQSGSFFGRIVAGPQMAALVLAERPFFGLGLSNVDGGLRFAHEVWDLNGAWSRFPWYANGDADNLVTSGVWWQLSYFGILGEVAFIGLIFWLLRAAGVRYPSRPIALTAIIWYGSGSGVDAGSWLFVAIFALSPVVDAASERKLVPKARDEMT